MGLNVKVKYVYKQPAKGRDYYYFRKGHFSARLPDPFKSPDAFYAAYAAALSEESDSPDAKPGRQAKKRIKGAAVNAIPENSVAAYCREYQGSIPFQNLAPKTQEGYRRRMKYLTEDYGRQPMEGLTQQVVAKIIDTNPRSDVVVNGMMKMLSILAKRAVRNGLIPMNPIPGVDKRRVKTRHYPAWPDSEVEKFREAWPLGTKQRTAFEMGINTGQRISDVCAAQWGHIVEGYWRVTSVVNARGEAEQGQHKVNATRLTLPIRPRLAEALSDSPQDSLYIVGTTKGERSAKAACMWFRAACDKANVDKKFSFHGLRSTAAVHAVEAGLSEEEVRAWTGHKSTTELRRYIEDARQEMLATQGVERMERRSELERQ